MRTDATLSDGVRQYAVLLPGEEPRHYERPLRPASPAEARSLLERTSRGEGGRAVLSACLEPGQRFAAGRMSDGELCAALAPRLARGDLRLVERVVADAEVLRGAAGAFRLLRGTEPLRAGESAERFLDQDGALRFVKRLHDDPWTRRGVEQAARRHTAAHPGGDSSALLRRLAGQLATGQSRLVRLSHPPSALAASSTGALTRVPLASGPAGVEAPPFQLSQIPDVMEHRLCWPVAAALMRRWFGNPPHTITEGEKNGETDARTLAPTRIDETTVTMAWALRFARPQAAAQRLLAGAWNTANGRDLLLTRVRAERAQLRGGTAAWRFGDLSQPARVLDETCQMNRMVLDSDPDTDPLDDWYGAMGRATLKIAVSGRVTQLSASRCRIVLDEVGLYLRDTYDFVDSFPGLASRTFFSQPLGFWNADGVSRQSTVGSLLREVHTSARYQPPPERPGAAAAAPARCTLNPRGAGNPQGAQYRVQNNHFDEYRRTHRRGGDFVVYSDVLRRRLRAPVLIDLPL
jgi:hypothetical protein